MHRMEIQPILASSLTIQSCVQIAQSLYRLERISKGNRTIAQVQLIVILLTLHVFVKVEVAVQITKHSLHTRCMRELKAMRFTESYPQLLAQVLVQKAKIDQICCAVKDTEDYFLPLKVSVFFSRSESYGKILEMHCKEMIFVSEHNVVDALCQAVVENAQPGWEDDLISCVSKCSGLNFFSFIYVTSDNQLSGNERFCCYFIS